LPNNYIGYFSVAYDQAGGIQRRYHNDIRIIEIPDNGFLETQFRETPVDYIEGKMAFVYRDDILLERCRKISAIDKVQLHKIAATMIAGYSGYNLDSVYVVPLGYNQVRRSLIEDGLGKRIDGNIEMFRIDTLKNVIGVKNLIIDKFKKG